MKTSSSQFDLMVTFMEQHGDLNKPSSNAIGKLLNLQKWEELTRLLNSDGSGDTKTCEKWRKVWSDYKNNIKKKAARLHRAVIGTGGGPAIFSKLSDLEQRVLNLIGMHVATGLAVDEAGLSQVIPIEVNLNTNVITPNLSPSQERPIMSPPLAFAEEVLSSEIQNEAGPSVQPHVAPELPCSPCLPLVSPLIFASAHVENIVSPTQPPLHVHLSPPAPALAGQTTPRRSRPTRFQRSPRRHRRPVHSEQATQHFLQAEDHWREFKKQQHKDYMDMKREQNRLREMELHVQRDWQAVAGRAIDLLNKLVDKYCRD